jgi:hypothetical protein
VTKTIRSRARKSKKTKTILVIDVHCHTDHDLMGAGMTCPVATPAPEVKRRTRQQISEPSSVIEQVVDQSLV